MASPRRKAEEQEHLIVVSEPDLRRREAIRGRLEGARVRSIDAGPPPYRVRFAHDCEEAARLVGPEVSALVLNLSFGRGTAVKVIESLRPRRPDLAILGYVTAAPRADAMAAMMAGADHVMDWGVEGQGLEPALDLALDRRWLALLIERSAADIEEARRRLARMGGNSSVVLPGLRPPAAANAVLPFNEAVRRYLAACVRLYEGDPRGLAERLGMSYFALRRLLKRYGVPFPGRSQRGASRRGGSTRA